MPPEKPKKPTTKKTATKKTATKKTATKKLPSIPTKVTPSNPARPGPRAFVIHRILGAKKRENTPNVVRVCSVGDLFAEAPATIDARVARSVYASAEGAESIWRYELDLDNDPEAASNAKPRTFPVVAKVRSRVETPLMTLDSEASALFMLRRLDPVGAELVAFDPITLEARPKPVPLPWLNGFDDHYSHLLPAGPGLLCFHGYAKGSIEALHLFDASSGELLCTLKIRNISFVRAFHATPDPADVCLVGATDSHTIAALRVRRAAGAKPRFEVVSTVHVGARSGSYMLDVGPCPPSVSSDGFCALTVDTDRDPGVTVRRWLVRPDAPNAGERITAAGIFACEDMCFDTLYRTLCLLPEGQIIGLNNDCESAITWGPEGFSNTVVPMGDWADYRIFRVWPGSPFALFGGGQIAGFLPPERAAG